MGIKSYTRIATVYSDMPLNGENGLPWNDLLGPSPDPWVDLNGNVGPESNYLYVHVAEGAFPALHTNERIVGIGARFYQSGNTVDGGRDLEDSMLTAVLFFGNQAQGEPRAFSFDTAGAYCNMGGPSDLFGMEADYVIEKLSPAASWGVRFSAIMQMPDDGRIRIGGLDNNPMSLTVWYDDGLSSVSRRPDPRDVGRRFGLGSK